MKNLQMKFIVLSIFTLALQAKAQHSEIHWISFQEALEAQEITPKKILMKVYTPWCVPCKKMEKTTFINNDVVNFINENFYAVKFNAEGEDNFYYKGRNYENPNYRERKGGIRNSTHQFAHFLKTNVYPTTTFFNETGDLISSLSGFKDVYEMEFFMKYISSNNYMRITAPRDFHKYAENFNYNFKIDH